MLYLMIPLVLVGYNPLKSMMVAFSAPFLNPTCGLGFSEVSLKAGGYYCQ